MCSEKTIYNCIDACLFDIRNIDPPRKVKFRERYKKPEFKVDKDCRIDRNCKKLLWLHITLWSAASCLFSCDAGSPYQKGAIEENHELLR